MDSIRSFVERYFTTTNMCIVLIVVVSILLISTIHTGEAEYTTTTSHTQTETFESILTTEADTELQMSTETITYISELVTGSATEETQSVAPCTTCCTTTKQTTHKDETIYHKPTKETTTVKHSPSDVDYLAAVIYQEAGADYLSDTLRQYVGEVVLNRVQRSSFPNTVYDVLVQKGQYGRYHTTGVKLLNKEKPAAQRAYRIAEEVVNGASDVPENVVYQSGIPQGSGVWKYIEGVYFCYE